MAAPSKREAREQARNAVNKWSIGFASVAWIPGSHYVSTAADIAMVVQIGEFYGVDLDSTSASALFATVAAPLVASKLAHTILDFIPVLGWVGKSAVAAAVTKAVGAALINYFEERSSLPA